MHTLRFRPVLCMFDYQVAEIPQYNLKAVELVSIHLPMHNAFSPSGFEKLRNIYFDFCLCFCYYATFGNAHSPQSHRFENTEIYTLTFGCIFVIMPLLAMHIAFEVTDLRTLLKF